MATAPEGDNRWTAVLSTDLAGFTELSQAIGPEKTYELLTQVLDIARAAIERAGGHVVDTAGDGILAVFGAPQALENAALAACRAALEFRSELIEQHAALVAKFGQQVAFRTAVASGTVMVAKGPGAGIKVVGLAVNKVARVQSIADPGEILISDTIRREAMGHLQTESRGTFDLKGFPEPIPLFRLEGEDVAATKFDGARRRGLHELVGRQAELDQVAAALGQTERRACVLLRGPAGIGKSRLTHEVIEVLEGRALVGQCKTAGQASPFDPFLDMIRQAAGVTWEADQDAAMAVLLQRFPDLQDAGDAIGAEDGSFDQTDRALRLRSLYLNILLRLNAAERVLFVIEDAHWIDPTSRALLQAALAAGLPFLITARPEAELDLEPAQTSLVIEMQPLTETELSRIARAIIGNDLTTRVTQFIASRAEGNPLVAEEVARALQEDHYLVETPEGLDLEGDPGALVTGQLSQMILSRVDRLSDADRDVIRHASVIGRDFTVSLLDGILGRAADLRRIARTPGLIEEVGPDRWRFAHALVGDAIYQSLLSGTRQDIHFRIATAMDVSQSHSHEASRAIAEHLLQSNVPEAAAPHLVHAAGHSLGAYALEDVDKFLTQAYDFVSKSPELLNQEAYGEMTVFWLRAMDQMGNFSRGLALSKKLMPRLKAAGYTPALSIANTLTIIALTHAWEYEAALKLAQEVLKEAEDRDDASGAAWAKVALMRIYDETRGVPTPVLEAYVSQIEPVAEATGDHHMAMTAHYLLCSTYRCTGARKKALGQVAKIEAFSAKHGDRRAMGYAKWAKALIHIVEASPEKAYQTIKDARDYVIPGSGDARVSLLIQYYSDIFLSPSETFDGGKVRLREEAGRMKDRNIEWSMHLVFALSNLQAGALADGWRGLADAERYIGSTGHINGVHQIHATRVELLLALSGLTDPAAEAPPDRPVFPKKRPALRDLLMYLRLRRGALKRAEASINQSLSLSTTYDNPHAARFEIALGLIRLRQNHPTQARVLLEKGRDLAESEGLSVLALRAEQALLRC